jgi:amino acid adenylation domain-containing protein/thioester reductase-like protein
MAELDPRLARLSPEKLRLYQQRLEAKRRAELAPIEARCQGPGPHPLSFAQERFWFLHRLEPESCEYNITGAGRFRGRLDRAALAGALGDLVERHAALRTTFPAPDGVPGQVAGPPRSLELPIEDLRALGADAAERIVHERLSTLSREPFDLAHGPLVRARLFVLAEDEHVVALSQHHSISDGWSLAVLLRDAAAFYAARLKGIKPDLPALSIQFADYAAWQRERISGPQVERMLAFWRQTLAGAPTQVELPTDHRRGALATHAGHTLRFALAADVTAAARALAASEQVTLYVVLLAAFQGFLARLAGVDDVVVGSSHAGRSRRELEGLVGAFVNTLVLRTRCEAGESFRALIARAKESSRGAFEHAELPFEKLVVELAPERDTSRTPLFNVFFDMGVPRSDARWEGLAYEELEFDHEQALFDLALAIEDRGATLGAALEYATDLFERDSAERLWRQFERFLRAAVERPDTPLAELPLLDAAERALVLDTFNATALEYDRQAFAHRQFAQRAAARPSAIALEDGVQRVTYAELDARANRIARRLVRLGARRDERVAVCLPRSAGAIAALLGVWKAGAAYVPLDVDDPPLRLDERLLEVGALALVTDEATAQRLAEARTWRGPIVALDAEAGDLEREPAEPPDVPLEQGDLAYVLFTSGSTGKPKGVMIEHGALANHMAWVRAAFDLTAADRFLLRTPFTFDASLWEIVHPLAAGATLVVAPQGSGRDPIRLLEQAAAERISVMQTVPSLLRVWLDDPRFAGLADLRHLICAGEALTADLAARFREVCELHGLRVTLHNLYGPSEATIDASAHVLEPGSERLGRDTVPIGRPITNARAYVLDARGEPLPIGATGELWIGGDGLARGYWNDPALTAERFVHSPLAGARLYRTGDLARWLANGELEYVGRADRQLKLRGARVEPGEIEAELRRHPDVRDAAVAALPRSGGPRLEAFVVPAAGRAPAAAELRSFLAARLPRALVPAAFTLLDDLPRTSSEKVDVRALLALPSEPAPARPSAPLRTATERRLASLWCELLELPLVGADEDFFALGGHSLLAARLVARVRAELGVELSLLAFFEAPSVAAQARTIDGAAERVPASIPSRSPVAAAPLSFIQERLWFVQRLQPDCAHYNLPGGLELRGPFDAAALERAFDLVVARHAVLRSRFAEATAGTIALELDEPPRLERIDLSDSSDPERALDEYLAREGRHVFDLGRGPLLRAALLRLEPQRHVLAVNLHHAVADGWSLNLLQAELAAAYSAFARGVEPALPALELEYADYAAWQRAQLASGASEEHLAWWRTALADAPPRLRLPVDRPEPEQRSHRGATLELEFPPALAASVRAFARDQRVPLYPVLLANFAALLQQAGAGDDLVIGTAVSQRPHPALETLIGPFLNALPLRIDLSGEPDFAEVVQRAARTTREAFEHQDVPFERIVQAAAPARAREGEPLFHVSCDLLSYPPVEASFHGLETAWVLRDPGTTKFDLALELREEDGALRGTLQYSTDLFERATVVELAQRYIELLAAALADPRRQIAELELPAPPQSEAPDRVASRPPPTVLELFEAHARARPDAPALLLEHGTWTRGELDQRAEQWAERLRAEGVGREALVGLCVERSADRCALLLGVWKAGGAWLALDPSDPPERRRAIAEQARARCSVASRAFACAWPQPGDRLIEVETATAGFEPLSSRADAPTPPAHTDLAYVIPTSGTTGAPKLVAVEHGALAHHTAAAAQRYGFREDQRFLHYIPLNFDATLLELASALACGGVAALPPASVGFDPAGIAHWAVEHRIEAMVGAPAFVGELVREPRFQACRSLRLLMCGGEAVPPDLPARFAEHFAAQGAELHDVYGPTETCIEVVSHRCAARESDPVPIGTPHAGVRALVLGRGGRVQAAGLVGELALGGPTLARGYLHDEARTRASFVADPRQAGQRLYRTGDLVRRRADGSLVMLGRVDDELKLGGKRLSLAALAAVLGSHPDVREAALEARAVAGGRQLLAHVAVERGRTLDLASLEGYLAARVPSAWVPRAWRVLDELPHGTNGKVDRARLARVPMEDFAAAAPREHVEPRDDVERQIAALFAAQLGRERVGVHDDFFASGGGSLGAMGLVARLREAFGQPLPLADFYAAATVAQLAQLLTTGERARPIDLRSEVRLGPSFPERVAPPRTDRPRRVLLTGATGFLGAYVLRELLERGAESVVCLVRASDATRARARLDAHLARLGIELGTSASRVEVLAADLAAPGLGLDAATRVRLEREVDAIVHSGAEVHFLADYASLRAVNVGGTLALLELASRGGQAFHHVSTIGVLPPAPGAVALESDPLPDPSALEWGYEQSKWVAEALVQEAGARGLRFAIHRPGRVAGSSVSGTWNQDDFAARLMRGMVALGVVPEVDERIDLTPVDWVAAAIAHLALRPPSGAVYHLANPRRVRFLALFEHLRARGMELAFAPFRDWLAAARATVRAEPEHALAPLMELIGYGSADPSRLVPDAFLPRLDAANVERDVASAGILCPAVDAALLDRWIEGFARAGMLDVPPRVAGGTRGV